MKNRFQIRLFPYHDMFAIQVKVLIDLIKRVQKLHSFGDVDRELDHSQKVRVHFGLLVHQAKQRPVAFVLTDENEIGQANGGAEHGQNVGRVEHAQAFVFLVKQASRSLRGIFHLEDFDDHFGSLPVAFPCL